MYIENDSAGPGITSWYQDDRDLVKLVILVI